MPAALVTLVKKIDENVQVDGLSSRLAESTSASDLHAKGTSHVGNVAIKVAMPKICN
jgi:hypothetical protein